MSIIRYCDLCKEQIADKFGSILIRIREKGVTGTDRLDINEICLDCLVVVREKVQAVAPTIPVEHCEWDKN